MFLLNPFLLLVLICFISIQSVHSLVFTPAEYVHSPSSSFRGASELFPRVSSKKTFTSQAFPIRDWQEYPNPLKSIQSVHSTPGHDSLPSSAGRVMSKDKAPKYVPETITPQAVKSMSISNLQKLVKKYPNLLKLSLVKNRLGASTRTSKSMNKNLSILLGQQK